MTSVCALRKNEYLRGCTISRDVSRAAMDTIFRGTYRALRWLLLSRVVSCAATDAWTDMSPMGPGLRDSGCVSLGQTCCHDPNPVATGTHTYPPM